MHERGHHVVNLLIRHTLLLKSEQLKCHLIIYKNKEIIQQKATLDDCLDINKNKRYTYFFYRPLPILTSEHN